MVRKKQKYNRTYFILTFAAMTAALAGISRLWHLSPLAPDNHRLAQSSPNTEGEDDEAVALLFSSDDSETNLPIAYTAEKERNGNTTLSDTPTSRTFFSRKVWSYPHCFPDSNATQLAVAEINGIKPARTRSEVTDLVAKRKLTNISNSPYYILEELTHSMPYLVPKAQMLLNAIGLNFVDSLNSKGYELHLPIVTSVLRTADDIQNLQRGNQNSVTNSCHCYGTTVDITYNRFMPLDSDIPTRYDENLKKVLAEVLFDLRAEGRCYVKYEKYQACFHLTVI